jgi:hypothetical protein
MKMKSDKPRSASRDERVVIPLDPEEALRALLKVAPEPESSESLRRKGEVSESPETGSRSEDG